jgi:hypothetical protein
MPFTISHIAAVLPAYRPLVRARLFTAAVIGSMVPDFGILLPGGLSRLQTHSLLGLVTFCLPVGLAAYWLTLLLIRPALLEMMPDGAYVRLRAAPPPPSITRFSAWLSAAVVLLVGACTHLAWDAFTHENARGVRLIPLLSDYGPDVSGHPLHLYRWLQHGSSAVGLLVVMCALALWLHRSPAPAEPSVRRIAPLERLAWLGAYVLPALLVMAWQASRPWVPTMTPFNNSTALGFVVMRGLRTAADSLLLVSALIQVRLAASRLALAS